MVFGFFKFDRLLRENRTPQEGWSDRNFAETGSSGSPLDTLTESTQLAAPEYRRAPV
jgi:hypothetical protein